jgi:hypothetical protein
MRYIFMLFGEEETWARIDCADWDEAVSWAKKLPMAGGVVEIRPIVEHQPAG